MASYYGNILEEELKNKVAEDWFADYDATQILGKIDFSVAVRRDKLQTNLFPSDTEYLLWAEAKQGTTHDIYESFVQLILTIGKARTFDENVPPNFLGAFDAEKIAFLPYDAVMEVFTMNDFNWNVTASDHHSREFQLLHDMVKSKLERGACKFNFADDGKELARYIKKNFRIGLKPGPAIQINKNNFTHIYLKWLKDVKPTIDIEWAEVKKRGLVDGDFYLADILSDNNKGLKENLDVLLNTDHYECSKEKIGGINMFGTVQFNDGQKAHTQFWLRYKRPPREEYWDYIVERRDLLVPQDIRERKGSFFTPSRWVELSQEYIARELGEDWQDDYYVWDCCAGTGNLLAGLTNKWNVFASTLDKQDVLVMKELIAAGSLNLLDSHVFQFDFLNGSFDQLPEALRDIVNDPEKRRRLVIYINPPYAEATTATTVTGTGKNKSGVAIENATYLKYRDVIGKASKELFAQFFIRIYKELPDCILAEFSTLKALQAPNFTEYRKIFQARLGQLFMVPAATFDNVKGSFPIGFFIWRTEEKETFREIDADVYDAKGNYLCSKNIRSTGNEQKLIGKWLISYNATKQEKIIGDLNSGRNDFQNQAIVYVANNISAEKTHAAVFHFTQDNLIVGCVYLAVRQCIEATWLNDRDQFLWPKDTWMEDKEFQSDCLAYTLLHGQNKISSAGGTNHWIPFTEDEVEAKERFESHFMSNFIHGKHKATKQSQQGDLFATTVEKQSEQTAITFSPEAQAVMDAGRELWRYYHSQPHPNPNASFYDIRLHFQGTNDKGHMNPDSPDARYTELVKTLRTRLRTLADKLAPKVYAHGFLLN